MRWPRSRVTPSIRTSSSIPANLQVVNDDVFGNSPLRDSQLLEVESKLRVLTSRNVLTRVIDSMNLTQDEEFVKPGLFDGIKQLFFERQQGRDRAGQDVERNPRTG